MTPRPPDRHQQPRLRSVPPPGDTPDPPPAPPADGQPPAWQYLLVAVLFALLMAFVAADLLLR